MGTVATIITLIIAIASFIVAGISVVARYRNIKNSEKITFIKGKHKVTISSDLSDSNKIHSSIRELVKL